MPRIDLLVDTGKVCDDAIQYLVVHAMHDGVDGLIRLADAYFKYTACTFLHRGYLYQHPQVCSDDICGDGLVRSPYYARWSRSLYI